MIDQNVFQDEQNSLIYKVFFLTPYDTNGLYDQLDKIFQISECMHVFANK